MAKKPGIKIPEDRLAQFDELVAGFPGIERKGVTMPYTSLNGNMFSFLAADGTLALRLGKEDRDAFMKKYNSEPMVAHGVVMKDYIRVTDEVFNNMKILKKYMAMSYEYVKTLKPKNKLPKD